MLQQTGLVFSFLWRGTSICNRMAPVC